VWGSGQQTRVFVDARDIAKALVMLADCPAAHNAQPINIGHEREVSIAELVDTVVGLCGTNAGYVFDTTRPDGHARRVPDVGRLRQLIGYIPSTPLEETIGDMIVEFKGGNSHT